MSTFGEMQPEVRGLLIGLLYRAGVWMSHADDEFGGGDDVREMKALEHIIRSVAKAHEHSAFVQDIAQETLKRKEKWQAWRQHSFDILADCEKAAKLLKENVPNGDSRDYRKTVISVAETVAAAHGEFGMGAEPEENALSGFLHKVVGRLKGETDVDFMNISAAEQEALERLRVALHIGE